MVISTNVAYRIYRIQSYCKAIAFNTTTLQYMFLDGLSAELLDLIINGTTEELESWLVSNDLSQDDLHTFKEQLAQFGFWPCTEQDSHHLSSEAATHQDETVHEHALNIFQNFLRQNGKYYMFHLDLTNRCNEKCIHCYHPFEQYDYSKELTLSEIKDLIDTIYDLGVFTVTLSGGECLLRKDFFEILGYISDKGMLSTIFTNGLMLTDSIVRKIKNYRVKLVSISIYGDTPEIHDKITTIPGSFQKTLSGIELLKKHDIPFELKCVVLAENIAVIENVRAMANQLNGGNDCRVDFSLCGKIDGNCGNFSHRASMDDIRKVFFSNPNRYIAPDKFLPKQPSDSPCGAGKYGLYCSADGNIYPCVSFRLLLCTHKELSKISENNVLRNWLNTRISDFTDCYKHNYCKYCTEQCAGNNLIENGDYLDSHSISNCERAMIISEWFQHHSVD